LSVVFCFLFFVCCVFCVVCCVPCVVLLLCALCCIAVVCIVVYILVCASSDDGALTQTPHLLNQVRQVHQDKIAQLVMLVGGRYMTPNAISKVLTVLAWCGMFMALRSSSCRRHLSVGPPDRVGGHWRTRKDDSDTERVHPSSFDAAGPTAAGVHLTQGASWAPFARYVRHLLFTTNGVPLLYFASALCLKL
jgi:hypothetical protein